MGKYCAMRTCKYVDDITPNVKRHRFPSTSDLRNKWDQFVKEGNRNNRFRSHVSNSLFLCERHFEPSCYKSSGQLQRNAVPTVADKFTPEVALKFGLIPNIESELLENINKFSSSVIKRVRTPKPVKNTGITANSPAIKMITENVSENTFGNGTLELMVIDLGEEATTTDDPLLSSPVSNEVQTVVGTNMGIWTSSRFSSGTDHDTASLTRSTSSSRLRSSTNSKRTADVVSAPTTSVRHSEDAQRCSCGSVHNEILGSARKALKEFTAQTGELAVLKGNLKNVRRKYSRAMIKINTLTGALNQLKNKRKSDKAPRLDSCLHCGKVFD